MMRNVSIIWIILVGQILFAQSQNWYDDYLPVDYNQEMYLISDSCVIKYYKDSIIDFEINIDKITNNTIFTFWDNTSQSKIVKIEKWQILDTEDYFERIHYRNGEIEEGIWRNYFKGTFRKGIWKIYESEMTLYASGRYNRFILLRDYTDLLGEDKNADLKHGKWIYIDSEGMKQKIEYYKKGHLKKVKQITAAKKSPAARLIT